MADPQAPPTPDPLTDLLAKAPIGQGVRADAWDAFHQAANEDDLAAKLQRMPMPQETKAQLWDLKHAASTAPAPTFSTENEKDASGNAVVGSAASRYVSGAAEYLNPITAVKGLWNAAPIPQALGGSGVIEGPTQAAKAIWDASLAEFEKARDMAHQGRYSEAVGHFFGMLPVIGPAAARAGETIGSGDIAGGLGQATGLLAPVLAGPTIAGARAAVGAAREVPAVTSALDATANAADRASVENMARAISPQVGANKVRFGNTAAKIAPELARDPDLGAFSRTALAEKIDAKLEEARASLDATAQSRLSARTFPTQPIIDDLAAKRARLTAESVEGSRLIPQVAEGSDAVREVPVDLMHQYALRWMKDEMESFPFVKRTFTEAPRANGNAGQYDIAPGAGGARIYHEIVGSEEQPIISATRAQVSQAISDVLEGKTSGKLRQLVSDVATDLANGGKAQKAMETPGPFAQAEPSSRILQLGRDKPADFPMVQGRPLGASIVPGPNADRVGQIDQAITELKQLGPVARYEPIRRIREAYDQVAKAKYNPSLTADFLKRQGEANGAADVTGVLRDRLAKMDPQTAAANGPYSLYKSAHDVLQAAEETDRVRPTVGRKIMARLVGGMAGEAAGGLPGAVAGTLLGPAIDSVGNMAPTVRIGYARALARLADSLRGGNEGQAQSAILTLKALQSSLKAKRLVAGNALNDLTSPSALQSQTTGSR